MHAASSPAHDAAAPAAPQLPQATVEPREAGLDAAGLRRIGAWLREQVAAARLPGAVWAVARGGRTAWVDALGRLVPGEDAPVMTADAVFRIYSMTKPITSLAAMQLVEAGRLQLTDPLAQWLPEFADLQVAEERGAEVVFTRAERPITVHDLLRHTAGLTYEFTGNRHVHRRYQQAQLGSLERSNADFCRLLATLPLAHQPGTCWDYSRATDVLGRVVEVVAGLSLADYLGGHVLGPLGLHETGFVVPPERHHRIAEPFARDPDTDAPVHLLDPRVAMPMQMGGGGLMSTLHDWLRFMQALRAGGTLDGARVIGRATLAWMTADHLGSLPADRDMLPPGHGFGLGFAVRTATGLAPLPGSVGTYHWSGIAGTSFFIDPHEDLAAVLLTQAPGQRVQLRQVFRQMVYAALV